MDDQNSFGGTAPADPSQVPSEPTASDAPVQPEPAAEPAAPAAQPQEEQKCATCGQGEANCTCGPAAPAGGSAPVV